MSAFSNLSIKARLSLMLVFPIIGLLYFSITGALEKMAVVANLKTMQSLSALAVKSSALVHELQKERGMSAGFIGSKGEKFVTELPKQRAMTDQKTADLKALLSSMDVAQFGPQFKSSLDGALGHLGRISDVRKKISALEALPKESFGYYSALIGAVLDVVSQISKSSRHDEVARATTAYLMFLNGKEQAGMERATLNGVFASNQFSPEVYQRFISLVSVQASYFNLFASFAQSGAVDFYRQKMAGSYSAEVDEMRKIAMEKVNEGDFGIEPTRWFGSITKKIDAMKEVEDRLSGELDALVQKLTSNAQAQLATYAGITAAALVAALLLSLVIARSILEPVHNLSLSMQRMQESDDLTLRAQVGGKDEIARMSLAFNSMIASFQTIIGEINQSAQHVATSSTQLAWAADQVSKGSHMQSESAASSAAAIEQMTASIATVAENSDEVATHSRESLESSRRGNESLSELFGALDVAESAISDIAGSVKAFVESAGNISMLTQQVRDIAEQTNLLALNAAIEAARAGEQGRGFAVVADEVRKLAEKSALSANEIDAVTRSIGSQSSKVEETIQEGLNSLRTSQDAMENVAEVMAEATESVSHTTTGISNIAASVREQNGAITEIASNVEQIAHMVEQNTMTVDSVSQAAVDLERYSGDLQKMVGRFRY
jgi:methyl-accepting chemotaxis protein